MSALMEGMDEAQADMECMLGALAKGAYTGIGVEYIGNSLEILGGYLGQRQGGLICPAPPSWKYGGKGMPLQGSLFQINVAGWISFRSLLGGRHCRARR